MEINRLPPTPREFDFGCEQSARQHVARRLWGGEKPNRCPHCGARRIWENRRPAAPFRCAYCRKRFSIRTGTIMASSPLGVRQWLLAINILIADGREPSAPALAKMIGVSAPTAGFLARRIRAHADEAKALLGASSDAAEVADNLRRAA